MPSHSRGTLTSGSPRRREVTSQYLAVHRARLETELSHAVSEMARVYVRDPRRDLVLARIASSLATRQHACGQQAPPPTANGDADGDAPAATELAEASGVPPGFALAAAAPPPPLLQD